jgi:4-alpha-glucanotransferase
MKKTDKLSRGAGVLLPLFSLYGDEPIGTAGSPAAREFVDFLAESGFSYWQVLPLERIGVGDSPYDCIAAFESEPLLAQNASESDTPRLNADDYKYAVDYDAARSLSTATSADFDKQWLELKRYANKKGIALIGDLPFYVSGASKDVAERPELFNPKLKAGAPPDYFNPDGQNWGSPTYNWKAMKADGYKWWVKRLKRAMKLFDIVRLDHFRGFSAYWGIDDNGKGKWYKGPGMDLFKTLTAQLGELPIIAENLGDIDAAANKLLTLSEFPGMRVLQFGFMGGGDDVHQPHTWDENNVAYSGTHDNTTLFDWLQKLDERDRAMALDYAGFSGNWWTGGKDAQATKALIRTLYQSRANVVILQMQDILGYGADTRTNIPGLPSGNWRYRLTREALAEVDRDYWRRQAEMFGRKTAALAAK